MSRASAEKARLANQAQLDRLRQAKEKREQDRRRAQGKRDEARRELQREAAKLGVAAVSDAQLDKRVQEERLRRLSPDVVLGQHVPVAQLRHRRAVVEAAPGYARELQRELMAERARCVAFLLRFGARAAADLIQNGREPRLEVAVAVSEGDTVAMRSHGRAWSLVERRLRLLPRPPRYALEPKEWGIGRLCLTESGLLVSTVDVRLDDGGVRNLLCERATGPHQPHGGRHEPGKPLLFPAGDPLTGPAFELDALADVPGLVRRLGGTSATYWSHDLRHLVKGVRSTGAPLIDNQ